MKIADISRGVILGGRFKLVDFLGDGSFGYVWKAEVIDYEAIKLPPVVAIKIFKQSESGDKFLFREAQTAEKFDHSRLVKIFDAKRIDGLPIMWMEYVPGESLHRLIGDSRSPMPASLNTVLDWLKGIAEGLAHMHMQQPPVGHGDLKLDNVIVDPDKGVRLVDFGQSKQLPEKFVDTDGNGAFPYLAPELMDKSEGGEGKRCAASDIYAAGVIAYRILTGRFPRSSWSEYVRQVPFPRARELNASIPKQLDDIVSRCLEKKPEDRFATGCELLAAIESLQATANAEPEVLEVARPEHIHSSSPADNILGATEELIRDGKLEDALTQLEKAMQRMSTSPRILIIYGETSKRTGKYEAALSAFRKALSWMERNSWSDEEKRVPIEGIADTSIKLKRYEDAVEHYEKLVDLWPDDRWYTYRYGVSLALDGSNPKIRKAIEILQKLFTQQPSALIAAKIGQAYEELGDINQACTYYNEAIMFDEYEPTALFQLGRIRAVQGREDKAMECLDRLCRIDGAEDQAQILAQQMGKKINLGGEGK